MPKALYGEPSGSLKSIDGDSDSPVLVDQPPPLCTFQDSLPLSVDQHAKSSMGGPIGPPMVDDQSIPDLSDVTTELERLQPSDFQDPGDLTSSGSAPGCSPLAPNITLVWSYQFRRRLPTTLEHRTASGPLLNRRHLLKPCPSCPIFMAGQSALTSSHQRHSHLPHGRLSMSE